MNAISSYVPGDILYDAPTDVDKIGFNVYAKAFSDKIKSTDDFMVYGIYGAWGSGKTSLLKMIDHNVSNTKKIWFDAWRYKRKVSIFDALCQVIGNELKGDVYNYTIKKRVQDVMTFSKNRKESVHYDALRIDRFEKNIKLMVDYINMNSYNKIVVFIDDLDRCDPTEAMDFMENLKVFFNIPRLSFIIGVNYDVLFAEINRKYSKTTGREAYTEEYLSKIINFPFFIPRLDSNTIKKYIKQNIQIKEVQDSIDVFTAGNDGSLRSLKRMVNVYTLLLSIVKQRKMKLDAVILAKMLVIQLRYRETYNKALLDENYIIMLQNVVNSERSESIRRRRTEINPEDIPNGLKQILRLEPPFPNSEIRRYINFIHSEEKTNDPGRDVENAYLDLIKREKFEDVATLQIFSRKFREDVIRTLIENFDKYNVNKKKEVVRLLTTPYTEGARDFLENRVLRDTSQPQKVRLNLVEAMIRKDVNLEAYSRELVSGFAKKSDKEKSYILDVALVLIRSGKKYGVDILEEIISEYDISNLPVDRQREMIQLLGDSGDQKAIDIIDDILKAGNNDCIDDALEAIGKLNIKALLDLYEVYMYSVDHQGGYISALSHHISPNSKMIEDISVDTVIDFVLKGESSFRKIDGIKLLRKLSKHYIIEYEDVFLYGEENKINEIINPIIDALTYLARQDENWQVRDVADTARKNILRDREELLEI